MNLNDLNNTHSKVKDAFLPIHIIDKDTKGNIINQRSNVFQVNEGENYKINYKLFLPKNFHLAQGVKPSYDCKIVNGKLNVPQITFTYIEDSVKKQPTSPKKRAKPIVVSYFDIKTGQTVKKFDVISGQLGEKINILDQVQLPKGYTLQKASKVSTTITNQIQSVSLYFIRDVNGQTLSSNPKLAANHAIKPNQNANSSNQQLHKQPQTSAQTIDHISKILSSRLNHYNHQLGQQLLNNIDQHNGKMLQKITKILLTKFNYQNVNNLTPNSNNGLTEGAIKNPQGNNVYLRIRKYDKNQPVTINEIREFVTSIMDHNAKQGLFITTSSFNPDAQQEAQRHHIMMIDRNKLSQLMIQHNVGLKTWHAYKINKVDKNFFK